MLYSLLLSVRAIRDSRIVFQRMRSYAIYACAVTIRIVACFTILASTYKFDFPPFMVLIIALLNLGAVIPMSMDCTLPSNKPNSWNFSEVFVYAIAYGLHLTASTIVLFVIMLETSFFEDKFGARLHGVDPSTRPEPNHRDIHMIIYLQVALITQALVFVTRSHGFFFLEKPSFGLVFAFIVSQSISSIIAAYADWGFAGVHSVSGTWILIVWAWVGDFATFSAYVRRC